MLAWYLLYSKPQQERLALENLVRQGYEGYLPLMRGRRRVRGRYASVVAPMFPRYLFIRLSDETDDWGPIRSTIGVSTLVRFGLEAARVPEALVGALREREGEDGVLSLPEQRLRRGDRVRIVEGAMAGYEAIFEARTGRERVVLLLEVAGRLARVQVGERDVEPVAPDWALGGCGRG